MYSTYIEKDVCIDSYFATVAPLPGSGALVQKRPARVCACLCACRHPTPTTAKQVRVLPSSSPPPCSRTTPPPPPAVPAAAVLAGNNHPPPPPLPFAATPRRSFPSRPRGGRAAGAAAAVVRRRHHHPGTARRRRGRAPRRGGGVGATHAARSRLLPPPPTPAFVSSSCPPTCHPLSFFNLLFAPSPTPPSASLDPVVCPSLSSCRLPRPPFLSAVRLALFLFFFFLLSPRLPPHDLSAAPPVSCGRSRSADAACTPRWRPRPR